MRILIIPSAYTLSIACCLSWTTTAFGAAALGCCLVLLLAFEKMWYCVAIKREREKNRDSISESLLRAMKIWSDLL
jgi:hypothetical protein